MLSSPKAEFTQYAVITSSVLQKARIIAYQVQRTNHLQLIPASEKFLRKDDYNALHKAIFEALFNYQNILFFDGLKEALKLNFRSNEYAQLKRCFSKIKNNLLQEVIRDTANLFEPEPVLFNKRFQEHEMKSTVRLSILRLKLGKKRESENGEYLD